MWRALREVESPFYVEVGASDPVVDSLTAALSREGGRGVLLEADPVMSQRLREARPRDVVIAAAASSRPGVLVFHDMNRRGWGSVSEKRASQAAAHVIGEVSVPAVRLADVLDELAPGGPVHFLSVDVEGHEAEVLAGAGLDRHRPWILCVEATLPNSREPAWHEWEPDVLSAGYGFVAFDGLNRWYVADEHADLAPVVAEPFGVLDRLLDGWVPSDVVALQDQTAVLHRAVAQADDDRAALTARLATIEAELAAAAKRAAAATGQAERDTAERDALSAALTATAHELKRLRASRSWRLTEPLRRVLHMAATTRSSELPRRAVFVVDRALQARPERRQAVIARLSALPGLEARLRALAAVPAAPRVERTDLHATADNRARRAAAVTWRRSGLLSGSEGIKRAPAG